MIKNLIFSEVPKTIPRYSKSQFETSWIGRLVNWFRGKLGHNSSAEKTDIVVKSVLKSKSFFRNPFAAKKVKKVRFGNEKIIEIPNENEGKKAPGHKYKRVPVYTDPNKPITFSMFADLQKMNQLNARKNPPRLSIGSIISKSRTGKIQKKMS